jgi:hypothetical protein
MSKSSSKSSEAQKTSGASGPWSYATPAVKSFTDKLASAGGVGMTPDQASAFGVLKTNAAQGNPFTGQIANLANDSFNTADRSGLVGQAYNTMQNQLGGYASGANLDPMSNPQMQAMLQQVGDDAQNRINAQFAGAGRDLSGMNSLAASRGVAQATTPLLFNQYNQNVANQMSAANSLYGAGQNTAATQSSLDAQRQAMRAGGVEQGQAALDARNYGANTILNLDQQIKDLPYEDLQRVASLLFPAAGLGGTTTGNAQGNQATKTSGFNLGSLLGSFGGK